MKTDQEAESKVFIRSFRKGMRNLERQVELALQAQTECCGVTPAQCHLLLALEESGEMSVGEVAAVLELDGSTLSRTVDGLVRIGMLSRREDPANRRRQLVSLTATGQDKADTINELCDRFYEGLLSKLPARDVSGIARALPVFVEAMRESRKGPSSSSCCGAAAKEKS